MSAIPNLTGISIGGRAVLIMGEPGSGKSSLALALIDRGAALIGDDGVALVLRGQRLHASPPAPTAGMLEIRNVGLIDCPTAQDVPVALVLHLDYAAPRYIDAPEVTEIAGASLPLVRLWPDSPVLHLRAEAALARWGLP